MTIEVAEPPSTDDLTILAAAAHLCKACPLWEHATQTVFGEGLPRAAVMLLGEQPGDQEDKLGHPFVGPAGRILDEAMREAGYQPEEVYVTNAVKHFKWELANGRRLHKKPNRREVFACFPWLEAEIRVIDPAVVVCLGATAAQSLLGKDFKITAGRGKLLTAAGGRQLVATVHPSFVLRQRDKESRQTVMDQLISDLRLARQSVPAARRAYLS